MPTLGGTPKRLIVNLDSAAEFSPDGRQIAFVRYAEGYKPTQETSLMVANADGTGTDLYPSVSPDGRYVVFESWRSDGLNVWRVDIDGGNPVQLTKGNSAGLPHCSPDGRWVYYSVVAAGESLRSIWKVPIEGGKSVRVTDRLSALTGISPDGKWLAYYYSDPRANPRAGVAVASTEGGPPIKLFDISVERVARWTPDGRGLAYIDHRNQNVWAQPIDGGPPRQLTDFKTDQTFAFAWSRDGKRMALARGTQTSDVVTITDFK